MHEYSIVQALVDRVEREAAERGATAVHALSVRIGALAGVETTLLATAFETFRQGTICAGARLDIVPVAAEWGCRRCALPLAAGSVLRCAGCGGPASLLAGDEIFLDRIELELAERVPAERG